MSAITMQQFGALGTRCDKDGSHNAAVVKNLSGMDETVAGQCDGRTARKGTCSGETGEAYCRPDTVAHGVTDPRIVWSERIHRGKGKKELKKTGFSGTVTNTSLHDVIQLICIGRNSCRMLVRSGTNEGWLYFRDGEIVHAAWEEETGEEAFYVIVSWELGVFECDMVAPETETIHESWDFLLMESMRRLDTLHSAV